VCLWRAALSNDSVASVNEKQAASERPPTLVFPAVASLSAFTKGFASAQLGRWCARQAFVLRITALHVMLRQGRRHIDLQESPGHHAAAHGAACGGPIAARFREVHAAMTTVTMHQPTQRHDKQIVPHLHRSNQHGAMASKFCRHEAAGCTMKCKEAGGTAGRQQHH
jgi:hypothetical protein